MADSWESTLRHLSEHGYVVLEGVLTDAELGEIRGEVDDLLARERAAPFEPEEGDASSDDASMETYLSESYPVSPAELARIMRRIRHTRKANLDTPWPVDAAEVNKLFLHLPTLFDLDRSQRIWNLAGKADGVADLIEHPTVLALARAALGQDCVLSDCSATSIGAHTEGGSWHVDVPLGQLGEPLPDFPLTTQNVWMLDDFTEENGATRVVPGSHRTRRKPEWSEDSVEENEIALTASAGSVAMWLSSTWHRSGPNRTEKPRRAVLCYYGRSWIKPFSDFRTAIPAERARRFSPTLRYLIGHSANPPARR